MESKAKGTLIIGANSIGDPRDIPARCLEAVRTADLLIFEEDRPARQILKQAGVHRTYLRYTEHREEFTEDELKKHLREGKTALYMSDQGVPGLADPGRGLIDIALSLGAKLVMIPGPSSVTAALAACPFDISRFHFAGFLSREHPARQAELRKLASLGCAAVVLDTPYRLQALLEDCAATVADRRLFLALDITGPDEQYQIGKASALLKRLPEWPKKLNFVMIIEK